MKTLKQLAQDALDVQNASNILGVSKSFAQAVQDLADIQRRAGGQFGTSLLARHSIIRLWVDKLRSMSGECGPEDDYCVKELSLNAYDA